jgi:hypothetical protein
MTSAVPHPPPIHNFTRWLMASVANAVHYADGAAGAAAAPLPETAKHVPAPATMHVWGQVFDAAGQLVGAAARQTMDAFAAHPIYAAFEAVALLWLVVETVLLTSAAFRWFKAWKRRLSGRQSSERRPSGPGRTRSSKTPAETRI